MSQSNAVRYEPIAVSAESTVVAEFVPDAKAPKEYQSEADLEREFIDLLQSQAYEYLPIKSRSRSGREPANPARGTERHRVLGLRVGAVLP